LEQWEDWNADPSNPFFQQVDLDNIALIGHSRGGEAAALAATFNRLDRYPGNAHVRWYFNFGIKSVVAIAPVDMQWRPADHPNPLMKINYLILQGSHDADLYYYDGIQQYRRADFTDPDADTFKAAVYIYRANHGQFNTSWGDRDYGGVRGMFLNTGALLSAGEQQQLARLMISAFLEDTLKGNEVYRGIFKDYRAAGDWLPQTGYITQYQDYGFREVAGFEEDIDPQTASLPGAGSLGSGLTRWREKALRYRNGDRQDNHAVLLGWKGGSGRYTIDLPSGFDWPLNESSILVFKAADARDTEDAAEGVDFRVEIRDTSGKTASVILSNVLPLQTQFPADIYRLDLWNEEYIKEESEAVFQSYRIPLEAFLNDNPTLDLSKIQSIRFVFDQTESGEVYLDGIGFDIVE
jgi:dienelactone hydrolase